MNAPYRISSSLEEYCLGRMVGLVGIVRIGTVMSLSERLRIESKNSPKSGLDDTLSFAEALGGSLLDWGS
jgi:hypothetical protein